MKRVILTGADGFIGRQAILPLLARDYEVHAVSNREPTDDLLRAGVTWYKKDLLQPEEVVSLCRTVKATHLLHFAWYVEHGKFWSATENEQWMQAGRHLIETFDGLGGERIVMAGTCAEYEWGDSAILHETKTPLMPQNFYGRCKAELQKNLAERDISQAWGRIFFLYGEYEPPGRLVASVINALLKNEVAECSHGHQVRDFLYVKDVADAFVALLDSGVQGPVNVASGTGRTIREIVLAAAEIMKKVDDVRFGVVPSPANEPKSIVADTQRLTQEVGWRVGHTLSQGLAETIRWWENR